jgi:hypothetical protein
MKPAFRLLIIVVLLATPWIAVSAADTAQFDLLKEMSVEDYRATGLDKLSDAQVKALSAWFANYESQHVKDCAKSAALIPAIAPTAAATKPAATTSKRHKIDGNVVTTSRIQGKFTGWYGSTVFKLQNGQTWEQSDNQVMTIAAMQNPEVTITKGAFNVYYLQVKGLLDSVQVNQIEPNDSN